MKLRKIPKIHTLPTEMVFYEDDEDQLETMKGVLPVVTLE